MATAVESAPIKALPLSTVLVPPGAPAAIRNYHWAKWAAMVVLCIAIVAVWLVWRAHSQNSITYETVALGRGTVQASITATGAVNAVVDVQVGSQVSGNIKALYADFNTKVTKGQLVALIDPALFQTQVDQAQSAASSAQSAVLAAAAQIKTATSDLRGTEANVRSANSVLTKDTATALNARNQSARLDRLFKLGISSQQDQESAKAVIDAADAQVAVDRGLIDASQQTVQSARQQVAATEAQLESAKGQQRQATAVLDQANINLAHTRITAPVDGTVIARRMDVGQTVAASFAAPTVFEIAQDLTKMQLDTNVDESDVGNIRVGQNSTFTVDAYPANTFTGKVTDVRKAPIVTQNVVTYDVVISVSNLDLRLFPGMTANVRIMTIRVDNTLTVPNALLRLHPSADTLKQFGVAPAAGKDTIYVVRNRKLEAVPVVFGITDGKSTAVQSHQLRAGENVVIRFVGGTSAAASKSAMPATGGTPRRTPGL